MKTLFLECNMGAAGDMILSALMDCVDDRSKCVEELNNLGIPGIVYEYNRLTKSGICCTHIAVKVNGKEELSEVVSMTGHCHAMPHHDPHNHHGHIHSNMTSISQIIDGLNTTDQIKNDVKNVYSIIAEAESKVHGSNVTQIHFHEVGAMDAIADIAGCAYMIRHINPDHIVVSPVATGYGMVKCAHGILPVPAPATAVIIQGMPTYAGIVEGELCTPTGAAILKYFADEFSQRPYMKIEKEGYGTGTKEFSVASFIRAFVGEQLLQKGSMAG